MPSNFFSRLRRGFQWGARRSIVGQEGGQQDSVETLIGQGKILFGNSRFLHSGSSATFSDLNIFLRPGNPAAAQSNLHLVNRTKNISVVGAVSYTFSIPSMSGPSFEACGYQVDCLLSKPTDFSVGRSTQKKTMAVCDSDFLPSDCSFSGLSSRYAHPRLLVNGSFACYNNRSVDSCRISMSLSRHKLPNDLWLYGYYAYNVAKRRGDFNLHQACGLRGLHVSPACLSAGTATDVSFENSALEEQLANYANSTEVKLSGDRTLKLHSGSCYLPHPDKEETGGEDAHFICADEQAIGVADGVGGWADLGVDAGQYARELMSNSANAVQEEPKGSVDTARVLEKAYSSTKAKGSSTACIIALTDQGLHAVNLGDSGFMVIRDGSTVFRSPTQQHDFNFTYQLESGNSGDLPSSGQVYTIPVAPGDVIIAGTDGLFDNLYNQDITAVVVHAIRAGLGPQATAQKIATLARQRAQDKNRQTPFSAAAQDAGFRYYGGKLDDITVVVSYITSADKENSSAAGSS